MNTRAVASEYRKAEWAQIMRERADSGESINSFCESRGIRRNQYFYWQRKLRESVCEELIAPAGANAPKHLPTGWALAEIGTTKKSDSLTVDICGCKIEVTQNTDAELLTKTCRVLRSL